MTIRPAGGDITVQRHAPYPGVDPWVLREQLTGVPYDLTAATITMVVSVHDKAETNLLEEELAIPSPLAGQVGPPTFTREDHEGLPGSNLHDPAPLAGAVRFRFALYAEGVPGLPGRVLIRRAYYIVEDAGTD